MPRNRHFSLDILIGGVVVPEYEKDGQYLVECNLNTPLTYKIKAIETVQGDKETQEYPVTPYQIRVTAHTTGRHPHYFRVLVDGVKVKGISLDKGQSKVVRGFRDGPCVRELLFSIPRFARDEGDRLCPERRDSIGKVEVECWLATLKSRKIGLRMKELDFEQANKKDSNSVTEGKYIMATSRAGKKVGHRSLIRSVDSWKLESRVCSLSVHYHMAHTLMDMGITVRPLDLGFIAIPQNIAKSEVKTEPDGTRFPRKRPHSGAVNVNPQDAAAALLALQGQSSAGSDGSSNHNTGEDQSNAQEQRTETMIEDDRELEIIQVVDGSQAKKMKSEHAIIDLTVDSDGEGITTESNDFQGIQEIKCEDVITEKVSTHQLPDSGISSSVDLSQENDKVCSMDSGIVSHIDLNNPTGDVAMEAVIECSEVSIDELLEPTVSRNTDKTNQDSSATNHRDSETKQKDSESNLKGNGTYQEVRETNQKDNETNLKDNETYQENSETNQEDSETNQENSETNLKGDETNQEDSETNQENSETNLKGNETNQEDSETNQKDNETNPKDNEIYQEDSESNLKDSETNEEDCETNHKSSETNQKDNDTNQEENQINKDNQTNQTDSETNQKNGETNQKDSETILEESETNQNESEQVQEDTTPNQKIELSQSIEHMGSTKSDPKDTIDQMPSTEKGHGKESQDNDKECQKDISNDSASTSTDAV